MHNTLTPRPVGNVGNVGNAGIDTFSPARTVVVAT
jgi:hypothetical protein